MNQDLRGPIAQPFDSNAEGSSSAVDDPRVAPALDEYLDELQAGRRPSRAEFLGRHPEIAEALGRGLDVLELLHSATGTDGEPGSGPSDADVLPSQTVLGDYRLIREVGRGGMGVVYEAEQVSLGRRVAVKVLSGAGMLDPRRLQRFRIEAQAVAQLNHPHIVPIFAVGSDRGIHYYAMQYVEGSTLAEILESHPSRRRDGAEGTTEAPTTHVPGAHSAEAEDSATPGVRSDDADAARLRLAPTAAGSGATPIAGREASRAIARLGIQAAEGLDHAHAMGVLHRDIKPSNLLIDARGNLWITDFGLARFQDDSGLTATGDLVGTLRYMAPEMAMGRRMTFDPRSDIYSLGATLYELLTLRPVFTARDRRELLRQIALDEPIPLRRIDPAIPRDVETIVMKAMAKDPSHRYTAAQELAADLGRFLADEPILARRPGAIERSLRWARRHRDLVVAVVAVAVVALIACMMLIWAHARQIRIEAGKTVEARNAYYAYMIESYPLIDRAAMEAINQALSLPARGTGPADRQRTMQNFKQWVKILQQASDLPLTDRDSRIVIARATARLGYARALLSMAEPNPDGRLDADLLAQAAADYRRSVALLQGLLDASPDDPKVCRFLADALGVFGMGCCFRFAHREEEAESSYVRSIELRRALVRGRTPGGAPVGADADVSGEVENFDRLLSTIQILSATYKGTNRQPEAEALERQLEDDVVALAARTSGPESQALRSMLTTRVLLRDQSPATQESRQRMVRNCRWMLLLEPENPYANNNLAWALVSAPADPWFDPEQALELARKAVKLNPASGDFWNTLGVAAFRLREWNIAEDALRKSIRSSGGAGIDCFFLAMSCWQQGHCDDARQWFDRAVAWIERTKSEDAELRRFHAEAAALLGRPGPRPQPGPGTAPQAEARTDTVTRHGHESGRSG